MRSDVKAYFYEQYSKVSWSVVPGHWPDFKSKDEVDKWIARMGRMLGMFFDNKEDEHAST